LHLIMFDIDGTLVNSYGFDEDCYLEAAEIVLGKVISSNWDDYSNTTDTGILDEAIKMNSIPGDRNKIHQDFKRVFVNLISDFISNNSNSIREIRGASQLIQKLKNRRDVKIAIATGGFEESAKLKLKAVGINTQGCAFASSSDHYSRTEIMKIAKSRVNDNPVFESKTYFGDAEWDQKASETLGYSFILVGDRISWSHQINDFQDDKSIFSMLNL
jgi:phosphoglycolate phosphatase-like HAD superfamily hydrolase